jgi:hypothetical protein
VVQRFREYFRLDADAHAIARAVKPDATVACVDRNPLVTFEPLPAGSGLARYCDR